MFRPEGPVGGLADACLRLGHVLDRVPRAATGAEYRHRSTTDKVRRRQKAADGAIQLRHRGLKETLAPGAANSQLLIKGLPANPYLGHRGVGIVIQPLLVPYSGCYILFLYIK